MDKTVSVRFVRDDRRELVADGSDWLLTEIEGAAAPLYELFVEDRALGDGGQLTGKRAKARDLQLSARGMLPGQNDLLRAQAIAFFNPKHSYQIHLTFLGRTRWISAELAAFQAPAETLTIPQGFSAYFLASDPYWKSEDDFGHDIASISPRWGFPYMDHPTQGVLVDVANFSRQVTFDYDGDVSAPVTITLTADGAVTNPCVMRNEAYIRLLDTLQAGDVVVITLSPNRITKNGESVLNKVDRTSNFSGLRMQPGTNVVGFAAEYGDQDLHVVIQYNKQYLGV